MQALSQALLAVEKFGPLPVPKHLVNAETSLMKQWGYGKDYDYPHANADGLSKQHCLPDELSDLEFYQPSDHGKEADLKKRLEFIRKYKS